MVRRAGENQEERSIRPEGPFIVNCLFRISGYAEPVEVPAGCTFGRLLELEGVDGSERKLKIVRGGETVEAVTVDTPLQADDIVHAVPEKIEGAAA